MDLHKDIDGGHKPVAVFAELGTPHALLFHSATRVQFVIATRRCTHHIHDGSFAVRNFCEGSLVVHRSIVRLRARRYTALVFDAETGKLRLLEVQGPF